MRVAAGISSHSGWAWVVTAGLDAGRAVVLGRERVELVSEGHPRQPYHEAHGADIEEATLIIEATWAIAAACASEVLRRLDEELRPDELVGVAVVGDVRDIPDVATVLASHARMHACEGELYRAAMADAGARRGLIVTREPDPPVDGSWADALDAAKATLGVPWQKEHRRAAAAALDLLAG